jgi:hypothetical protein
MAASNGALRRKKCFLAVRKNVVFTIGFIANWRIHVWEKLIIRTPLVLTRPKACNNQN